MQAVRPSHLLGALCLITATVWGGVAEAATLILGASAQSRYDAFGTDLFAIDGRQSLPVGNTLTGFRDGLEYRSYFVFNVSSVSQPVAGAKLRLLNKRYYSTENRETIALFDVDTPAPVLVGGYRRRDIFRDLGEGKVYGTQTLVQTPPQTDFDNLVESYFEVTLTGAAIADINQAVTAGDRFFSIGVKLAEPEMESPYIFSCETADGRPIPGCKLTGLSVEGVVFSGGATDPRQVTEVPGQLILDLADPPPYTGVPESSKVLSLLGLGVSGVMMAGVRRFRD